MAESLLEASASSPNLGAMQNADDPAEEVTVFMGSLRPFWGRVLIYIVLLFVVVAVAWAWWGRVDMVAVAPFRLVPLGQVQTVQAQRGGEVEMIGVRDGDRVEKGEVLFKLRSWETWGDLRELEQAQVVFEKAAYDLNEALPKTQKLGHETLDALEKRRQVLQAVMGAHRGALDMYRAELDASHTANGASDVQAEIGLRQVEIEHLKREFLQQKTLYDRRLLSRSDMDRARVQYLTALAALPGRMSEIYKQEMAVQDLKRQILETRLSLDRERAQAHHVFETAKLRFTRAQQKVDRTLDVESDLVLAPEAGIVTQVLVNTPGQVVNQGQPLVTFAPLSAPMVAEVMVMNKDVGLLKVGQVVKLKYDAFAFQNFGIKRGRLDQISPDALIDEKLGLVFRGVVKLEETTVRVKGQEKPLMYGMKGVAEVITDRQSILLMLLSPLRQLYESAVYM